MEAINRRRFFHIYSLGLLALLTLATRESAYAAATMAQQAYLKASNTRLGSYFGTVAVSGNTVVVGAFREDSSATGVNGDQSDTNAVDSGAVYVFVREGTNWNQQAYLKASNTSSSANFGTRVAISGDTLVVGAWPVGSAYVFVRNGTTWSQQAILQGPNPQVDTTFGTAVSVSGDTVVVGAVGESSNAKGVNGTGTGYLGSSGAAYVFVRNGTTWTQQAYLKASNPGEANWFGHSVAVSGETVIVGALHEDSETTGVNGVQTNKHGVASGAAYVFTRTGTTWSQQAFLKAGIYQAGIEFGYYVAASGDTVVVGAPLESGVFSRSGAAYVFARNGTNWSQEAYLKAGNAGIQDFFGSAVGVSADRIIVGATGEDSNATGVNGDGSDNSTSGAGAAYVFTRTGATWTQQAYLKAGYNGNDSFGAWIGVSGDTFIVSAYGDDSAATGVNGDGSDHSAPYSGAAYVFTLQPQASGQVQLQNSAGGNRPVTFVATGGVSTRTWTSALSFTGDTASYQLSDVPSGTTSLSAKGPLNLRVKRAVTMDVNGNYGADFVGTSQLKGGDLTGDNIINLSDYSLLAAHFYSNFASADITGDGLVDYDDYFILTLNWFTGGDPQ